MNTKKLKACIALIEKSKVIVAKERDKLRDLMDELESLLEPFDEASSSLDFGISEINSAIDKLSEQV
jgi:hypothetical protein